MKILIYIILCLFVLFIGNSLNNDSKKEQSKIEVQVKKDTYTKTTKQKDGTVIVEKFEKFESVKKEETKFSSKKNEIKLFSKIDKKLDPEIGLSYIRKEDYVFGEISISTNKNKDLNWEIKTGIKYDF